ncbi:T6SS immunity protein Tli4 family protein [Pantoea trifolii]|uniref:T6SS immunity protein Tli4 family protein n=1 Tax=Pantoea trifolii TaxID=2968030 RepID=A0ABT1VMI0_9GAMM|nr:MULTISPECIES: T6SS immunity protein Tli4 family protein [unclassified Pantoea]MCQ8228108.1 T6SS immunity protein Tli4 family protein [Pantoea sp. MMK2]MCQ8236281.1 T6SS immunity protein Tli4 family protein [Pantoea sp. MMK3]
MKIKKKTIALLLFSIGSVGWYGYNWLPPRVNLSSEEHKNVTHFLKGMTTRCIGRFLIDMPEKFISPSDSSIAYVNKSPVKYKRIYRPAFEQKIKLREAELAATKTMRTLDMPYLKGVYPLPDGMHGVIFERNESYQILDSSRILEAHIYTNGVAVEITMKARNGTSSRYDEDRKDIPEIYGNTVPNKIIELTDLLKRVTGKQSDEIPVEPGFCLPELFIKDVNENQKERYGFVYKASEYPALDFDFDSDNYSASEDSLLERSEMMERNIKKAEGYTIANGRRDLNGLYAEQWLAEGLLSDTYGEKALRFAININEKTASPLTPMLSLTFLQQGLEGEGRLTQVEAVTIWQKITETIRIRPNAFKN